MRYYKLISSVSELLGEEGIWRLPEYLPEVYVMDEQRKKAYDRVLRWIDRGENVLIVGPPGTGKTAFMLMVLKGLLDLGCKVGIILEGATQIGKEHEEEGIILFYDDLPRMNELALRSIVRNNVRGLVATARIEEIPEITKKTGARISDYFMTIEITGMGREELKKMLLGYADKEGIKIEDSEAIDIVVSKAQGLPVYVWQVIRELRIKRKGLSKAFAEQIPQGMYDYIDDILWRVLDEHPDRYAVLLTLLIMTDLARYAINQDLYHYVFVTAKEEFTNRRVSTKEALLSDVLDAITRYLARESATMTFRLPHDSWADVLRGRSSGPMSAEISKVNTLFPYEERRRILEKAARRAWEESISQTRDRIRRDAFLENVKVNLGEELVKELLGAKPTEAKVEMLAPPKPAPMPLSVPDLGELVKLASAPRIDFRKALELAEEAIRRGIEDENLLNAAAVIFLRYWERVKEKKYLERALEILKRLKSGKAKYNLGTALLLAGKYSEALEAFKEAIAKGYDEPSVYYNMAIAALRLNMPGEALKALEKYLVVVPHDLKAERVYRRLRRLLRRGAV